MANYHITEINIQTEAMPNNRGVSLNPPAIKYFKTFIQIYLNIALTLDSSTY